MHFVCTCGWVGGCICAVCAILCVGTRTHYRMNKQVYVNNTFLDVQCLSERRPLFTNRFHHILPQNGSLELHKQMQNNPVGPDRLPSSDYVNSNCWTCRVSEHVSRELQTLLQSVSVMSTVIIREGSAQGGGRRGGSHSIHTK